MRFNNPNTNHLAITAKTIYPMRGRFYTALVTVLVSLAHNATHSLAISLPVVNPGFEDTTDSVSLFNEFSFGSFNGWTLYDDPTGIAGNGAGEPYYVGTLQPSPDPANPGEFLFFPDGAPEGNRVGIAYRRFGNGEEGEFGLEQTLVGTPLEAHRTYRLRVEVGNIASGIAQNGEFFPLDGFSGYRIDLLAGGQVIDQDLNSLASTLGDGEFDTSTILFSTGATHDFLGQELGIRLVNLNQPDANFPTSDLEVDFDDVRLDVLPAIAGDFNFSGVVDASDYTVWRDGLDIDYSSEDYLDWRNNYGASSASVSIAYPTPEPATLLLFTWLLSASCIRRRVLCKK